MNSMDITQPRSTLLACIALMVYLLPVSLSAAAENLLSAPLFVGAQFQVNAYTTGGQRNRPHVAVDDLGGFVIVWPSEGSPDTDTDYRSTQGQRYDLDGVEIGAQFQVNSYSTGDVSNPWVGGGGSSDFVVVWQSNGSPGNDSSSSSIQGQRFNSSGTPQATQFQVNSVTSYGQKYPSIGVDAGGNFVVVWAGPEIHGQRYDSGGIPMGGQFQVNSYSTGYQGTPTLGMHDSGDFLVVWESRGSLGTDSDSFSLQGQRFAANGTAQGVQFQVNSYTTGDQFNASVAPDPNRGFVVAWHSDGSYGSDTDGRSIQVQRLAVDGSAQGQQSQVNTYTTGGQNSPKVTVAASGAFVVVWHSDGSFETDVGGTSIQGQSFAPDGSIEGVQFQVNTYTTGDQFNPSISLDDNGTFITVWRSDGSSGTDTDSWSVQGLRFQISFFFDSFESGDTSAWSGTVP